MSDFLSNLIARSFAGQPAIRPRLPSLFESAAEPFNEVQSSAPPPDAARTPSVNPSVPKSFAKDQPAMAHPAADATAGSPEEKTSPAKHDLEPLVQPSKISSPRPVKESTEAGPVELQTKKTIVPVIAAFDKKDSGQTAKTPSFQEFSERRTFPSRRQNSFSTVEARPSAPAIHVTIGRVEVRAVQSAAPTPKPSKTAPPKLSLDDYLQKRDGSSR